MFMIRNVFSKYKLILSSGELDMHIHHKYSAVVNTIRIHHFEPPQPPFDLK